VKLDLIRFLFTTYLKTKKTVVKGDSIPKFEKILIMSNTAIGDTLFTTPVFRLIKEHYPDIKITAVLNPKTFPLFANNLYIDNIILYSGKWKDFFKAQKEIIALKNDVALIMHSNEPQATPLAYLSGIKYIIKIPNEQNSFNFLHFNKPTPKLKNEHFIDHRLKQLEFIGIHKKSYNMDIFIEEHWYKKTINFFQESGYKYIGLQIGASTKSRMWFTDRWVELIEKIIQNKPSWKIFLTGSQKEKDIATSITNKINSDRVYDIVGHLDLCQLAAMIDKLDILVTPDTGPLHIAASVKTPTVAFSVAGRKIESNPRSTAAKHLFIEKSKTCNPCIDLRCKYQKCMYQITAEEVYDNILKIIEPEINKIFVNNTSTNETLF